MDMDEDIPFVADLDRLVYRRINKHAMHDATVCVLIPCVHSLSIF
jgi:hypothetical protein